MRASASAAQIAGRGSTDSNRQFMNTHASSDSVIANGPYSVDSKIASAARWIVTITPAQARRTGHRAILRGCFGSFQVRQRLTFRRPPV